MLLLAQDWALSFDAHQAAAKPKSGRSETT
jgi:hypothetical protein